MREADHVAARDKDTEGLAGKLSHDRSVAVLGPIQCGKSWLIERAINRAIDRAINRAQADEIGSLKTDVRVLRVSLAGSPDKVRLPWHVRIAAAANALRAETASRSARSDGFQVVAALNACVPGEGRLLLWLEQCDDLLADGSGEEMTLRIRNWQNQRLTPRVRYIFEAQAPVPYLQHLEPFLVGELSQGDALALAGRYQPTVEASVVQHLHAQVGGHVFLLRQLFEAAARTDRPLKWYLAPVELDAVLFPALTAMRRVISPLASMNRATFRGLLAGAVPASPLQRLALVRMALLRQVAVDHYQVTAVPLFRRAIERWCA